MRTRPREVVRMLAMFRRSAQCRALRAASAQEAMRLAREEADEASAAADTEADSSADTDTACNERAQRRMH